MDGRASAVNPWSASLVAVLDRQQRDARGRPSRARLRGLKGGRRCALGLTIGVDFHGALEVEAEPGPELGAARVDIARRDAERTRQGCGVDEPGLRGRRRLFVPISEGGGYDPSEGRTLCRVHDMQTDRHAR